MKRIITILTLLITSQLGRTQCIDSSLIWDLRFEQGTTGADSSIYGLNASLTNGLLANPALDRFGKISTYQWDGTSARYISKSHNLMLKPNLPITVSAWVYLDTIGVKQPVFMNEISNNNYSGVWIDFNTGGNLNAHRGFGSGGSANRKSATTLDAFEAKKWYKIMIVYRADLSIDIYVNENKQVVSYSGNYTGSVGYYNNSESRIGYSFGSSTPTYFIGKIDDIKMWNREFSDIDAIHHYIKETNDSSIVLIRSFDNNYIDESIYNQPTTTTGGVFVADRYELQKQALNFNGVNDRIGHTTTSNSLKVNFPFSFSTWIYLNDSSDNSSIYTNNDDPGLYSGFWIKNTSSGQINFSYGNNGSPSASGRRSFVGDSILHSKKWYNIIVVAHKFDSVLIFIDGKSDNLTMSGLATSVEYINSKGESIGAMKKGTGNYTYFNGLIDNLNIWNRVISPTEIQYYYSEKPNSILLSQDSILACNNETIPLIGLDSFTNYHWTESNILIGQDSSQVNISYPSGVYKIKVSGCDNLYNTINDSVLVEFTTTQQDLNLSTNSTTLCENDVASIYSNEGSSLASFQWFIDNGLGYGYYSAADTLNLFSIGNNTSVFSKINYDCHTSYSAYSDTIQFNIVDLPSDSIYFGNGIQIEAYEANSSYQWINCNNGFSFILNDTNQNFFPQSNGDYAVIIDNGVCPSDTSICINISTVNLLENNNHKVIIYPNPSDGILNFIGINHSQKLRIKVYDIIGNLILNKQINNQTKKINLPSSIKKGKYTLELIINNDSKLYKSIIIN